jgi:ABC-type dipeptide/oligopeptide/nickel transport system permease component
LITVGVLIASMLGNFVDWRFAAISFAIPSALMSVMMYLMPESPTHIIFGEEVSEKTIAKARESLGRLRTYDSTIDMELEQLIQSKAKMPSESFSFFERIRHSDFSKPLIYSMSLMLLQQFSGKSTGNAFHLQRNQLVTED